MKDHKNCRQFIDSLSEYVDGELQESLCRELERHIADCDDCRIVLDSLKKTIYLYHQSADEPALPSDMRSRLFRRLDLDDFIGDSVDEAGGSHPHQ